MEKHIHTNPMGPCCVYIAGQKTTTTGLTFQELENRYIENKREVLRLKGNLNPTEEELWTHPMATFDTITTNDISIDFDGETNCNFVALDVEIANNFRRSICSIGIAKVVNGIITETKQWIVKPEPFEVGYWQSQINGFTLSELADKPSFNNVWNEIKEVIGVLPIVCHNASFDYSAVKHTLQFYDIEMIANPFFCSLNLSKKILPNQLSYSLGFLAPLMGVKFEHHKSDEDAYACAAVTVNLAKIAQVSTIEELDFYSWQQVAKREREKKAELLSLPELELDKEHLFYEKEVVFTGDLQEILKADARKMVEVIGGKTADRVTTKTNFLVVGHINLYKLKDGVEKTQKLKKAEELILKGQNLEIVDRSYFLNLVFK